MCYVQNIKYPFYRYCKGGDKMKNSGYNDKLNIAGDRIRAARKLADLSQAKLATKKESLSRKRQ